jgi:hypothetical protein
MNKVHENYKFLMVNSALSQNKVKKCKISEISTLQARDETLIFASF